MIKDKRTSPPGCFPGGDWFVELNAPPSESDPDSNREIHGRNICQGRAPEAVFSAEKWIDLIPVGSVVFA